MKVFGPLYARAIAWARHPRAQSLLVGLSFVEAFIFPVMPEVMLGPMCLAQPRRALRFATLSLLGSLVGSLVGYALGHYAWEALRPLLSPHMQETISVWVETLRTDMQQHWWAMLGALLVAALQPVIPMKFVTWAAGIVGVPMLPFLACMVVGRGKRVYVLAIAIRIGGERAEAAIRRYIEPIGWLALALLAAVAGYLWWRSQAG
ncbi:MAG TPA: VTT domain-containing protein [Xanthomonadaceae bacterium]|jgi:membrane protein YqaA with SNARE-associated domain|nr:VTT domain-containing protein [Xanthomonadaceae bacterium]